MDVNQLENYSHIFFIGIGGISMSGLAEILRVDGKTVEGSDQNSSAITDHLDTLGIPVHIGHNASNIHQPIDLVVYTAAIKKENVEFQAALELGIPLMERATLLGLLMKKYPTSIGVSGTHGKTTTTSMISHILLAAELDPTISVGGMLKAIHGNFRVGHSDYFVTEACEYSNSYHKFYPYINIVLNIEADHLDFFKDIDDIRHSFRHYMENTNKEGFLILNDQIQDLDTLLQGLDRKTVIVGSKATSDYTFDHVHFDIKGFTHFTVYKGKLELGQIQLHVPGDHNIQNALAAIAAADILGISWNKIVQGLSDFKGAARRFDYVGTFNDIPIYDDYAHHPTEIQKTIEAARHLNPRQLWVIFEPHTYSRTKALYTDFVNALSLADHVIVTDIYAAREKDPMDIHSSMFVESLSNLGTDIVYIADFDEICKYVQKNCVPKDMLITMGAGNVTKIGPMVLK